MGSLEEELGSGSSRRALMPPGGGGDGPSAPPGSVYGDLLRDFESLQEKYRVVREAYEDISGGGDIHLETCCQTEIVKYKTLYQEMLNERNQFKTQCTQAIQQWDQALRERNEFKDALSLAQRKHDEAVKEVNQVISVKLKASKDLKRLTDERNAAMQEYSLIMSERDSVHKEIERLQDEISSQKKRASAAESQSKIQEVDKRKMYCHIEILKREIENSLLERDKALREVQELREKIGISGGNVGFGNEDSTYLYLKNCKNFIDKIDTDRTKRNVLSLKSGDLVKTLNNCETLDQANSEICRLLKLLEKLQMDLHDARIEADIDKGRRDLAFSERDKILLEREAIRTLCDKLRHERDRADCELAEANRDAAEIKALNKRLMSENAKLRSRIDEFKKGCPAPVRSSESPPLSDCVVVDSLLWENKTLEIKLRKEEDVIDVNDLLGFEVEDVSLNVGSSSSSSSSSQSLPRVTFVREGSEAHGILRPNDLIQSINDMDLRGLPTSKVQELLLLHGSPRRITLRISRRYSPEVVSSTVLTIKNNQEVGLSLQAGVFVSGVSPGSLAEGRLGPGDRLTALDDWDLSSLGGVGGEAGPSLRELRGYLRVPRHSLRVSYVKAKSPYDVSGGGGADRNQTKRRDKMSPSPRPPSLKSPSSSCPTPQPGLNKPLCPAAFKSSWKRRRESSHHIPLFGGTWPRVKNGGGLLPNSAAAAAAGTSETPGRKVSKTPRASRSNKPSPPVVPLLSPPGIPGSSPGAGELEDEELLLENRITPSFFKSRGPISKTSLGGDDSVKSGHEDALIRYLRRSRLKSSSSNLHPPILPKRVNTELGTTLGGAPGSKGGGARGLFEAFEEGVGSSSSGGYRPPGGGHHYASRSVCNSSLSPRIRIPSNTSVTSNSSVSKMSTSSMDKSFNKCSSPLPFYSIEYLSSDGRISESLHLSRKSVSGEIRQISIQKSSEQLGFTIEEGAHKGVFVSSVNDNSLAQLVGLQVGDQLLEVCGINLRSCGKEQAARVLHQVGTSITLKVQYNPEDYLQPPSNGAPHSSRESSSSLEEEDHHHVVEDSTEESQSDEEDDEELGHEDIIQQQQQLAAGEVEEDDDEEELLGCCLPPRCDAPPPSYADSLGLSGRRGTSPAYEPRLVYPRLSSRSDLGVRLVGGNAVGIFIHSVEPGSPAYRAGLRSADQILEYDGVDLRCATAEMAAYELAKPAEHPVALLVQYNPDRYTAIKDGPGDSYYVRTLFDRRASGQTELGFLRDDILFVENTMYNGVPGLWSAWALDPEGRKLAWGVIPSKYKVEEELLTRRSLGNLEAERRGWTSARRSFFKRKKAPASRGGSVPKELASYSDMGSLSDSGNLLEEALVQSYVRVERFDGQVARPILLIGPYVELVLDKLSGDFPQKFARCETEILDCELEALEKGIQDMALIDFKRRACRSFEVTSLRAVKDVADRDQHCILNIHIESVERLHQHSIFPIVLLLKFKSIKQIREMKDPRLSLSKISHKDAKNIYEYTQKLENEHRHLISDIVHAGANLMLICTQIASHIEQEQGKTLWVPSSSSIW